MIVEDPHGEMDFSHELKAARKSRSLKHFAGPVLAKPNDIFTCSNSQRHLVFTCARLPEAPISNIHALTAAGLLR
jgi:hypothetical protein